jgi:hypothetical protein
MYDTGAAPHSAVTSPARRFWRPFLALLGLGLFGLLSLPLILVPQIAQLLADGALPPRTSVLALTALSLLGPAIMLLVAVAGGVLLAPRVGLRSHLAAWAGADPRPTRSLLTEVPLAVGLGLVAGLLIVAVDRALTPLVEGFGALQAQQPPLVLRLVAGVFYGGIVEELLLRWGLMTLLVWAGWRLLQGGRGAPQAGLVAVAALLSAVVFGALHLPALAAQLPLTPLLVARTVLLNALGGLVYGWLFWRQSLEAAMVAHAATHVGFALAGLVLDSTGL